MSKHLRMSIPLRQRLANSKAGKEYKNYAYSSIGPEFKAFGEDHCRWIEDTGRWRFCGWADKIARRTIRHTGWYTDEHGDGDKYRGIVFRLPARNGVERFVYGYTDDSENPGAAAVLCFDLCDDLLTAAIWADHVAERAAEQQRDDDRKWREEQDKEAAEEARLDHLAACHPPLWVPHGA